MDGSTFDHLIATMSRHGTRRGLFGLVAALPLLGGLFEDIDVDAKGRRKRRKKRHNHRLGDGKDNGRGYFQQRRHNDPAGSTVTLEPGKSGTDGASDNCWTLDIAGCTEVSGAHAASESVRVMSARIPEK